MLRLLLLSLLAATALAGLAAWRKALTRGGLLLAWALAVVIGFCGGLTGFLVLAATFVFTIASGKLSGVKRERAEKDLHAKTGARDAAQIFCNVFTGALMLVLFDISLPCCLQLLEGERLRTHCPCSISRLGRLLAGGSRIGYVDHDARCVADGAGHRTARGCRRSRCRGLCSLGGRMRSLRDGRLWWRCLLGCCRTLGHGWLLGCGWALLLSRGSGRSHLLDALLRCLLGL